jgi:large subunit ribosomal protein L23
VKANRDILIRPLITEKIANLQETERKVGFVVAPDANKVEIQRAVEKRFNVKVEKVATANFQGKTKRMGRFAGRRPDFKKAVVTLKEGFKIEFFEGK